MKKGRRHVKLKEQAYLARKDAEGYARPYRPIDVAEPAGKPAPEAPPEGAPVASLLGTRAKKALRHTGLDVDRDAP